MSIDYSKAERAGLASALSEIEKGHAALAAALAAADRLAKLAGTIPLVNRTQDGNRTEK